jgi:hypothetical protein
MDVVHHETHETHEMHEKDAVLLIYTGSGFTTKAQRTRRRYGFICLKGFMGKMGLVLVCCRPGDAV